MLTSLLAFVLLAALLSVLVHADHQSSAAAEVVRIRDRDL